MGWRYKRYCEYKDSGSEWMAEIPKHWAIRSLKSVLVERKENNRPIKTTQILSLTMEKGVVPYSERGGGGNKHKDDLTAYKLAYPNDIVLNSMNVVVGSVGLSRYFGAVSPVYYMLRPREEKDKVEYFSHIFQCKTFQQSLLGLGNGILMKQAESSGKLNTIRMRIPMRKLNTQPLPHPPPIEQTQIAKFLDYETGKMDALIEKQQQLIRLLKEKRQAVISHAVTKGLNPAAPMRDSGIAWLGEVPAHWTVAPLKRFVVLQRGHDLPAEARREGVYPVVSSAGTIGTHDDYRCKGPGIITGRYGTIGEFYYANEDFWPLNTALYSINCHGNDERFLLYLLRSMKHLFVLNSLKSAVPGVDRNDVHGEHITAPVQPQEQRAIAVYLDDQMTRFDDLTTKAEVGITLLQERRTALISAAVTGKIDVRNWKPPTPRSQTETP